MTARRRDDTTPAAPAYLDYVQDEDYLAMYNAYQAKYAHTMRESDRVLIGLVGERLAAGRTGAAPSLLDIGCSTGNLLMHLRRAFPGLRLTGGDLAQSSLDACRSNPELAGIEFSALDLLYLPADGAYDIITVNAVLFVLTGAQLARAFASLAGALRPGGTLIAFDFFHPFPQDLAITETSKNHPNGLTLHFRRQAEVAALLADAGFGTPDFRPFTLPIDLPMIDGDEMLITYTVPAADGRRLPFRGTLFQPWCHLIAVRA